MADTIRSLKDKVFILIWRNSWGKRLMRGMYSTLGAATSYSNDMYIFEYKMVLDKVYRVDENKKRKEVDVRPEFAQALLDEKPIAQTTKDEQEMEEWCSLS